MKQKLLLTLIALFSIMGGVFAQKPTASTAPSNGRWAADTHWYFVQFPNSDAYHTAGYLATEGDSYINSNGQLLLNGTQKPTTVAGLWCFVGNDEDGYTVYNRKSGTGLVLSMTDAGVAKMLAAGTDGNTQQFDYQETTSTMWPGKATFKFHGSTNKYWNNSDGDPKCHLAIWANDNALADNGSAIAITEVTNDELVAMGVVPNVTTDEEHPIWFYLKNARSNKYAAFAGESTQITQQAAGDRTNASRWYVTADGNGYKLHNGATQLLYASYNSFTAEGATTYIVENAFKPGYVCVSLTEGYTAQCWDDNPQGSGVNFYSPKNNDFEGTSWSLEYASGDIEKDLLQTKYDEYTGSMYGINPGQYTIEGDGFATALAAAKTVLDNGSATASECATALTDLETAFRSAIKTKNVMNVGQYYRIQSTTRNTYTGLAINNAKTGQSKMLNSAYNESDPRQIWKLEQDGAKYYLVNVASGLYPQNIPSGSDKTALVGAKDASKDFTYQINNEATATNMPVHNIKFGGTQVNIEANGNVNYWTGENAHHYIWTVEKTDAEILALVKAWATSQNYAQNANATKIAMDPAATEIISPSEYAADLVNDAIDAVKAYADAAEPTLVQAQALYNNYNIVNTYVNASNRYGAALSFAYTIKANKWGTLFSPVNFTKPAEWTLYTCDGASEEGVLNLIEANSAKNYAFLVKNTADTEKTYQIIGYANGAATENTTNGLLTGVIVEGTKVPAGSYILATQGGTQAFYKVETENYTIALNKCYLTMPGSDARVLFLDENGVETAIENLDADNTVTGIIYNLAGQKLNSLQKGINIVNGKKILVK